MTHDEKNKQKNDKKANFYLQKLHTYDYPLNDFLNMIYVKDIYYDKSVLIFQTTDTLEHFLKCLSDYNCSCGIIKENDTIVGILDTTDVVSYIIDHDYDPQTPLINCTKKYVFIYEQCKFGEAMQFLKSGFRYIIVDGDEISLVSQGSVLRYIHNNNFLPMSNVANSSLKNLKICTNQTLIYATVDTLMIDAYETMIHNNITSLPICNNIKECISVISMSDIKLFTTIKFDLNITCHEFMRLRPCSINPIMTSLEDTLKNTMEKMITNHIHHIYITNDETSTIPIGVVSYIDIIKILV